ncbi:hypothetical protein ACFSKI_01445 [Pseudogracilibacillus auburnensis]|uniref:Uncharacterized protein n=1 Tax=Pseudogracilibacillus auburnensis TaxID=1494959 RepID=A0A2V3VJD9_9BACI|nr:hypothetical protein [Pseudogracilibacillus auburnensis]PXW80908.1 hypothetical protein DFR56_12416 [Pseudogracilibacillus auburnensis]
MKRKGIFFICLMSCLFIFSSPFWLWKLQPSKHVNVLIIDKTVPDTSYREHKGLIWLLNHLKFTKADGKPYDVKEDYSGFVPKNPPDFDVKELPEDLSAYEIIYLADSYGVTEDEYHGDKVEGKRSNILYGGMTMDEVEAIKHSLINNNQTFIAEFNSFGSPTDEEVKKLLYELLHVNWTGWIGRAFHQLHSEEVPSWVKETYEKQSGETYNFSGYGVVFVHEGGEVVILHKDDLNEEGVSMKLSDAGASFFQLDGTYDYDYWFDIVEPNKTSNVEANFQLALSTSGTEKLADKNIPTTFPAIIYHQHPQYESYYFAGDFVDQKEVPSLYQSKGIAWWKKVTSVQKKGRTDTFFWKAYVPIMTTILGESKEKRDDKDHVRERKIENDMQIVGNVGNNYVQVYQDGEWEDLMIKGVNMGIAKPGHFPGETAITKEEYARWFEMISEMNANAIRVYTIHPPPFYEALYEHNLDREEPLYLFHGVWVNEEELVRKNNAFDEEVTKDFKEEIKRIIHIIHGNAELENRAGHASGSYHYNISPYVLGWIIGVEWDPEVVVSTNQKNSTKRSFDGNYFIVNEASPFEVWLAEMMDYTATYEAETYHTQRPLSFTNWVTTDLLDHPSEPIEKEDMVSVDPNVIKTKEAFYPGVFASYHIYPYYPDFLNIEEKYISYLDHRGEKNNYAGYLHDLREHHKMPVLVAEFGIPASRGMTHKNIYGMNQGFHSEQDQGKYVSKLYEDIITEKMAGGLVFTWQDEWFKRTWNTMDYDNPDERPYWDNIQTNEQHFGLLSFDPQTEETLIKLDGKIDDWEAREEKTIYIGNDDMIKQIFMTSDERGIYVRMEFDPNKWNVKEQDTFLLLDTTKEQGQSSEQDIKNLETEGIDFVVKIEDKQSANVRIDSYYDTFYYHYGEMLQMIPQAPYAKEKNNGIFHPIRFALNKEMSIEKDGKTMTYPFESYETGKLTNGNGNPQSEQFNSLADYYLDEEKGIFELRLPWLLLNFKDPSKKEIMGDIWSEDGIESSRRIDGIEIAFVITDLDGKTVEIIPKTKNNELSNWLHYTWENWEEPTYHERLKKSYFMLQETYGEIK